MFIGGKPSHIIILTLITTYAVFTVWYSIHANTINKCVYATVPLDGPSIKNFSWTVYNTSLIYVLSSSGNYANYDGLSGYDYICRKDLALEPKISAIEGDENVKRRMRIVMGTRNCQAYLWCVHLKLITITWIFYITFMFLRHERRIFGPFRDRCEFIHPAGYTLNYTTRVISQTLLHCHYTEFARLMCEVSIQRQFLSQQFKIDPVTFLYKHPYIAIFIAVETAMHLTAKVVLMGTVALVYTPCAQTYPLYVKILAWIFVSAVFLVDVIAIFYNRPQKPKEGSEDAVSRSRGGTNGIFTNCCSTILAGLMVKIFYVSIIIGAVVVLLRYEQRIQINLFGSGDTK